MFDRIHINLMKIWTQSKQEYAKTTIIFKTSKVFI